MCVICANIANEQPPIHVFTPEEYEFIYTSIYNGLITTQNLDFNTYDKIAKKLTDGVVEGFGKSVFDTLYGEPDNTMLRDLRENVYVFSAAKTYQQTREVSALLTTKDAITGFSDFKEKALTILKTYNENYLKTEYYSAVSQASAAEQWMQIEKDKSHHPMLQYHTVGDQRVRYDHAILNNVVYPVDHPIWKKIFPPNDWGCRCSTTQEQGNEDSGTTPKQLPKGFKIDDHIPEIFQFNPGMERIIFSPKHPYFDVAAKDKSLARNNFNLPIPKAA